MRKAFLSLLLLVSCFAVFAQSEEATTKSGKKVILNPDGTWKQAEIIVTESKASDSECSKYIEEIIDNEKVIGKNTFSAKNKVVISNDNGQTGFGIFLTKVSGKTLVMQIHVGSGACINENGKIDILLVDGSKLALRNIGRLDCKGMASVYFGGSFGKTDQLEELGLKKIKSMKVWTTRGFVEVDFTQQNADDFFNTINCLIKI